jgi:hypothetical protein
VYRKPIRLVGTHVIRAVAIDKNQFSAPVSQTYLIDEPAHGMPIISVAMSPSTLFHPKYGIMVDGRMQKRR